MPVKVNMKRYQLGLYEKALPADLTWKDKLQAAKIAGYDYVEISIDESEEKIARLNISQEERLDLIKTMYEVGVPLGSMCVSALTKYSLGHPDYEMRQRGMKILKGCLQLASDLGIRYVMIPGYDIYYGTSTLETKKMYSQNIKKAADLAAGYGVQIGFETMENEFMNTVEKAMKYVTIANSHYVKIYPDIGNLTNAAVLYQHDVIEDLMLGKDNIIAMHLKETKPGHYREIPYGEGHVNFKAAIHAAWQLGVRRFVTEFWYLGEKHYQDQLNHTRQYFAQLLEEEQA